MTESPTDAALERSEPVRGIARLGDPRVWGTVIGATGGTVFVMANRGDLIDHWPSVALVGWIVAVASYVWFVFLVPRRFGQVRPVRPSAGLVYLAGVAGMLVLIRVGSSMLGDADRTGLRPALIVVAVGLHFLPFASAFHTSLFTVLGSVVTAVGCIGLTLGWLWRDNVGAWAAVVAGLAMILVIAADAAVAHHGPRGT